MTAIKRYRRAVRLLYWKILQSSLLDTKNRIHRREGGSSSN
jgi:hypothetical protein